jgi:hypothetical protein
MATTAVSTPEKKTSIILDSKYNTKFDQTKLFVPGISITDILRQQAFPSTLLGLGKTAAAKKKQKSQVTNEVAVLLNANFGKVDHVPGLKTTLYPHQQPVVKAMLDLEFNRAFNMIEGGRSVIKLSYNVGVLSEPVGSGKTIDVLAVICLAKQPRSIPDIMELPMPSNELSVAYIRRRFKKFLVPTIVFVGGSVMKQWQAAIRTFTDLRVFVVQTIKELKELLTMISIRSLNSSYDIVLVKNGKITRPIELPDGIVLEDKNRVAQAHIYNIIANLRSYCWFRVVVDDFDTIKLPHNAGIVNGLFTWYISSTRKKMEFRSSERKKFNSTTELLRTFDYGCANIMYNHILFGVLNVRNDIEFLKATTQVPNPKYHVAVFKNPNNRYISLLAGMGDDEVNRITEMLNGDAIGSAAEAAGIKTTSVASIFEKILGTKFKQYRFAGDLLAFTEHLHETEEDRQPMSDNPDPEDRYGKKDLLNFREVEYKYPGVNQIIKSTEEEYTEVKKVSGTAIERVKDNIKHGRCPVCRLELCETEETIIVKCCGTVFCGTCGIKAQNLGDRYNKLSNGRCSNCRATLTIRDLIYIGDNFDLSKIEKEEFEEEDASALALAKEAKKEKKEQTKYTAIIDIIRGIELAEDTRVDMYIPNMMKGGAFLKEAKTRKVLIFANFEETLKMVIKELEEEGIHYWRLMGTSSDIDKIVTDFTKCKTQCAMVIDSTKHCSGLNLQTATDLIFAHNIIDPAVESQVVGRGHRLGRTSPLNIWFMQYDNEYDALVKSHGLRQLSDEELAQEHKFEYGTEQAVINTVEDNTAACYLGGEVAAKKTFDDSSSSEGKTKKKVPVAELSDDEDDSKKKRTSKKLKKKVSTNDSESEEEETHHRYEHNVPDAGSSDDTD